MAHVPIPSPSISTHYLAPRFWLTWLMFGALRLIILLPYRWQMRAGRLIGRLALHLTHRRRHIAEINLALCFPEKTPQQRLALLKAHFDSLGCGVVETALCWWGSDRQLHGITRLVGLEHLRAAQSKGKGVILLSAHFTTLELGGRLLARHTPFHVLYRRHKNPLFESVMRRSRERRFDKAIARDDMRGLLASLKDGMPVWYAPDQNHGGSQSVFAPFFGVPASTLTTPSRLAKISGAAVVPFYQTRLADGSGYLLTLCPALENFPSENALQDATRLNALLESVIREMPEQYLWVHRRFKTRPEGERSPYT
ncbi:MAG TPA: LpxL/LpxP family Kdo(2)-lipid IV(A) lauroyl/palmitoleoyl acyltransferase [Gammaproteobacteria bacterium]|nr:LpxL/LpxP family Kdo(2)-lipid IV(A) lauroyl/palmitoleoyl acyltransferase [Gammaproteobacteria bacterium]